MANNVIEMDNILKVYPNGTIANQDVSLHLRKGEIHALLGENGAGKSTLMKILFGIEQPNEGTIKLNEQNIVMTNSKFAIEQGLGMVHQHFMLVPSFTVAENIILGVEPRKGIKIDMNAAVEKAQNIANEYDFDIDVTEKIYNLPVGIKQKVEILKALYRGAEVLILDEPTAVLTPQETAELFIQLKLLKDKGHTIIFISHKLDEVKEICDRLTILRHGKTMGTFETKDLTKEEISRKMVGRDVILKIDKTVAEPGKTIFKVSDLVVKDYLKNIAVKNLSFSLREGEILGIAGVEGNGQNELISTITGLNKSYKGTILVHDKDIKKLSIKEIRKLSVSHIPEDRMSLGVAGEMSITNNLITNIIDFDRTSKNGLLKNKDINELADKLIEDFTIKATSRDSAISSLSGGNIQKVVVAREMFELPSIVIANQPTRGVDVGAAQFIREKLVQLRDEKSGIILVSADLNEVFELCDSLLVMYKGDFVAYFENIADLDEFTLGKFMLGLERHDDVSGVKHE